MRQVVGKLQSLVPGELVRTSGLYMACEVDEVTVIGASFFPLPFIIEAHQGAVMPELRILPGTVGEEELIPAARGVVWVRVAGRSGDLGALRN